MLKRFLSPVACLLAIAAAVAQAAPITGNTGPAGIEQTGSSSNLLLWLDAGKITGLSNSDPVATWSNQSTFIGAASDATQTGATNLKPLWISSVSALNSHAAVRFDGEQTGTGDYLAVSSLALGTDASGFVIATNSTQNGTTGSCCRAIFSENTDGTNIGNNGYSLFVYRPNISPKTLSISKGSGGAAPSVAYSPFDYDTDYHIYGFGSDSSTTYLYHNAFELANDSLANTPTGTNYRVGGNAPAASRSWTGDVAEMIFFDREVNSVERTLIDNYLSAKYNVGGAPVGSNNTLGTNDHYTGDLDTKGDYDSDVFGIGNDGVASLTNNGTMGLGIEATGGSLGANEWVLAGHHVAANSIVSAVGGNVEAGDRWDRAWFIDVTGGVNASLAFDFSDGGLGAPLVTDEFTLLYQTQEGLTWQKFTAPVSVSGDLVTFNLVGLQDGYYTLGINIIPSVPEPSTLLLLGLGMMALSIRLRRRAGRGR